MTTTPEQIADLINGYTELKQYFENVRNGIEADRQRLQQNVASYIADAAAHLPVTPNLLADTKQFAKLCGGQVNVTTELIAAHGDPWSAGWYVGTAGEGTATVVTLDALEAEGIPFGGDLVLATSGPGGTRPFYGSDFRVLLLDVTITSDQSSGEPGAVYILNQGCPTYTGWNHGQFVTQSSVLFNLAEYSGDILFHAHHNMPAPVAITADDLGSGWVYRQSRKNGFGGCHMPHFVGKGHMKVAIALPYIGFGDHAGKFVWAGSVGRYSHLDQI